MTESVDITTVLLAAQAVTLGLGAVITHLTYRAYRRTDTRALLALAVGFATITLGSVLGGLVYIFPPYGLETSLLVQSVVFAFGFAIIVYAVGVRATEGSVTVIHGRSDSHR